MPETFEDRVGERRVELDGPAGFFVHRQHRRLEVRLEPDSRSRFRASSGLREREPPFPLGIGRLEQEDLDDAVLRVAAVEPRRPDPHVVAHEQVPGTQDLRQVGEEAVRDRARLAVEDEETARSARPGLLGDELPRQLVVEERGLHRAVG